MKIWVDADACPVVIKEILFKAAQRTGVQTTFVANQSIRIPASQNIKMLQVSSGFDVADDEIVKLVNAGDLVITADIPLAAEVIEKGEITRPRFGPKEVNRVKETKATSHSSEGCTTRVGSHR